MNEREVISGIDFYDYELSRKIIIEKYKTPEKKDLINTFFTFFKRFAISQYEELSLNFFDKEQLWHFLSFIEQNTRITDQSSEDYFWAFKVGVKELLKALDLDDDYAEELKEILSATNLKSFTKSSTI
ncbi:hypothetical protein BXY85_3515 [Roseivirga pacifica]|uniref:Uncharacterized protein n=1 Tax=Roseivirga pacifica TaxID=1267423 RepID=A0A1I0QHR8_9BACT|nr:hypothetical protein [Roseivirga pacifica]RKQ42898.1 hypothetical protein BXY85_3515 [Roseivirga pacifica]SEW26701.1 hypothetical protein SAMN05216290_2360 [Roseivirga pacifica]